MGCIYSRIVKDATNIEVLDYAPQKAEYDYLRPRGTIIAEIDEKFKVPVIRLDFDGWILNFVRLWPESSVQGNEFMILERTPLPPSTTSCTSSVYSSGYDTVFWLLKKWPLTIVTACNILVKSSLCLQSAF